MSVDFKNLEDKLTKVLDDIRKGNLELNDTFNTAKEFKHKIYKDIQKEYLKSEEYQEAINDINSSFDVPSETDYINYERTLENIVEPRN